MARCVRNGRARLEGSEPRSEQNQEGADKKEAQDCVESGERSVATAADDEDRGGCEQEDPGQEHDGASDVLSDLADAHFGVSLVVGRTSTKRPLQGEDNRFVNPGGTLGLCRYGEHRAALLERGPPAEAPR